MTSAGVSSRLPFSSGAKLDSPVTFPPGRAKLATTPLATGSLSCAITMGIVLKLFPSRRGYSPVRPLHDDSYLETH